MVGIESAAGTKVALPFLTREQADAVHADFADMRAMLPEAPRTSPENGPCDLCDGTGGWTERRESRSASGSTVVTNVNVPCLLCAGSGQMPDLA
ncbi:hypothetical protein SAMN05421505_12387 [Sinosporangium album]|uniref:Uncharacterized protein n=1 Tax=Sinosporangium album TaxID=504805 RepID=A0A1G8FIA3_9ACTN|nr:hypothetical protein SAMN05421505_12387 [Sinosporangium album]